MKRLSLIVSAVSAALMLSGCGSLTGFSNAKTDFACADLSGGPSCRNISQVYEENNPTTPVVLAATEEEEFVQPFFEPNQTKCNLEVKAESDSTSVGPPLNVLPTSSQLFPRVHGVNRKPFFGFGSHPSTTS